MSKRSLDGGTGDINPQFLTATATQATGNSFVEIQIPNPIGQGICQKKNKALVMEVLKVYWILPTLNEIAQGFGGVGAQLSTRSQTTLNIDDPRVFAAASVDYIEFFSETAPNTTAVMVNSLELPIVQDYTDGAGHGILVATPVIYFSFQTQLYASATAVASTVKILYRFKEVNLLEVIGMIQSQQ